MENTEPEALSDVEEPKLQEEAYFLRTDVKVEDGILRFDSKKKFHEFTDGTANLSDSIYMEWASRIGFSSLRKAYIDANNAFDFAESKCNTCLENVSELVTLYTDGEPILLNHSVPIGGLLSSEGFVQIEDRIYYL